MRGGGGGVLIYFDSENFQCLWDAGYDLVGRMCSWAVLEPGRTAIPQCTKKYQMMMAADHELGNAFSLTFFFRRIRINITHHCIKTWVTFYFLCIHKLQGKTLASCCYQTWQVCIICGSVRLYMNCLYCFYKKKSALKMFYGCRLTFLYPTSRIIALTYASTNKVIRIQKLLSSNGRQSAI